MVPALVSGPSKVRLAEKYCSGLDLYGNARIAGGTGYGRIRVPNPNIAAILCLGANANTV